MLYEWLPDKQHPFPYPMEDNVSSQMSALIEQIKPASFRKLIFEIIWALIFRNPRHVVSIDQGIEIIKRCLDEEYKFAQENQYSFACFFVKRPDLLMFLTSYQPDYLEKDYPEKTWGWIQRQILIL